MNNYSNSPLSHFVATALIVLFWCNTAMADEMVEITFIRSMLTDSSSLEDIAIDADNRTIILSGSGLISACDQNEQCIQMPVGGPGAIPGGFKNPMDLDVFANGLIVIADTGNDRVQICSMSGDCELLRNAEAQELSFSAPTGVAITSDDEIVVAEPARSRFQVCKQDLGCSPYQILDEQLEILIKPEHISVGPRDEVIIVDDNSIIWTCASPEACERSGLNFAFEEVERDFQAVIAEPNGRWLIADRNKGLIYFCLTENDCQYSFLVRDGARWRSIAPQGMAIDSLGRLQVSVIDRLQLYELTTLDESYIPLNAGLSDAWYQPEINGQGFLINLYDERNPTVFVAWFTFETSSQDQDATATLGSSDQRWLTAQGLYNTYTAILDIYLTEGGLFHDAPHTVEQKSIGTMTMRFSDCETGVLTYDLPEIGLSGDVELSRIRPDSVDYCTTLVSDFRSLLPR